MSRQVPPAESAVSYGRLLVVATVLVSFAALYGLSLASDPQTYDDAPELSVSAPTEDDYWRVPDPSHNKRIFALRTALEQRGFQLNGGVKVTDDPLASIRGVYGFISPHDEMHTLEWRLMATRSESCQPSSFLRLQHTDNSFSLPLGRRLLQEWHKADQHLPAELSEAGDRLLGQLEEIWTLDRAAQTTTSSVNLTGAEVLRRSWSTLKHGQEQYRLKLSELVGDYQVELEVTDNLKCARQLPSCDIVMHFRWLQ